MKVKEIHIINWGNRRRCNFLKKNKEIVVLIDEETSYYIIPKADLVIEDWSSRHTRGTLAYSLKWFIKELEK